MVSIVKYVWEVKCVALYLVLEAIKYYSGFSPFNHMDQEDTWSDSNTQRRPISTVKSMVIFSAADLKQVMCLTKAQRCDVFRPL